MPSFAQLVDQRAINLAFGIPFANVRGDFALGELAHHVANLNLLIVEIKIHEERVTFSS